MYNTYTQRISFKDPMYICLDPEAQDHSMTFKVFKPLSIGEHLFRNECDASVMTSKIKTELDAWKYKLENMYFLNSKD